MALVIHRRPRLSASRPRLLLVGGDGRWVRPLLRLVESFGFAPFWREDPSDPLVLEELDPLDLVVAANPRAARWVLRHRGTGTGAPVIVLTGSLQGLSTAIERAPFVPLSWPITRDSLEDALEATRRAAARAA